MAQLFVLGVGLVAAGLIYFHIVRPILESFGFFLAPAEQLSSVSPAPASSVMSKATQTGQTGQTDETDETDERVSVPSAPVPRLQLDKTRAAVIELLLTAGWTVADFRRENILRGDNTAISAELDAARARLGLDGARVIEVRANGGPPKLVSYYPDNPELEYRAPTN